MYPCLSVHIRSHIIWVSVELEAGSGVSTAAFLSVDTREGRGKPTTFISWSRNVNDVWICMNLNIALYLFIVHASHLLSLCSSVMTNVQSDWTSKRRHLKLNTHRIFIKDVHKNRTLPLRLSTCMQNTRTSGSLFSVWVRACACVCVPTRVDGSYFISVASSYGYNLDFSSLLRLKWAELGAVLGACGLVSVCVGVLGASAGFPSGAFWG